MNGSSTAPAERQTASAVLMVRPARFAANAQTLGTNFFQDAGTAGPAAAAAAQREFDALATQLAAAGVRVHAFHGQHGLPVPDEVFPNNWLSLHADGTAVLYPLLAPSRRRERRPELLDALAADGYRVNRIVDLTHFERQSEYLEGTGSLVLDRVRRVAYACLSPRTHAAALESFGARLGYAIVAFDAADRNGRAIYHTNVLMAVGATFAAICTAAIAGAAARRRVCEALAAGGHEVVDLTFAQLHAFAGNMLALDAGGKPVIALSAAALAALTPAQTRILEAHGELLPASIATIERYGGGSVRCMLAEVHLPRAAAATAAA
jgi:hypothetical protein